MIKSPGCASSFYKFLCQEIKVLEIYLFLPSRVDWVLLTDEAFRYIRDEVFDENSEQLLFHATVIDVKQNIVKD